MYKEKKEESTQMPAGIIFAAIMTHTKKNSSRDEL